MPWCGYFLDTSILIYDLVMEISTNLYQFVISFNIDFIQVYPNEKFLGLKSYMHIFLFVSLFVVGSRNSLICFRISLSVRVPLGTLPQFFIYLNVVMINFFTTF